MLKVESDAVRKLLSWYSKSKRSLPWRDDPTPYRVWISEIMLQQTQVATVIPYFDRFMDRFPTVESLAKAPLDEVYRMWSGLGYYRRARFLHEAAKIIVEKGMPENREKWLELPGIGPYTAGAIASISMHQPVPILDGNIERFFARFYGMREQDLLNDSFPKAVVKKTLKGNKGSADLVSKKASKVIGKIAKKITLKDKQWEWSKAWVQHAKENLKADPSSLNQALMEQGALICKPNRPLCDRCHLVKYCVAFRQGLVEQLPEKRKSTRKINIKENVFCMVFGDQILLLKPKPVHDSGHDASTSMRWRKGLYDFPDQSRLQSKGKIGEVLGEVKTKNVVTNHQISRSTYLIHVDQKSANQKRLFTDAFSDFECAFVDTKDLLTNPPVIPIGSGVKKAMPAIDRLVHQIHAKIR